MYLEKGKINHQRGQEKPGKAGKGQERPLFKKVNGLLKSIWLAISLHVSKQTQLKRVPSDSSSSSCTTMIRF